MIFAYPFIFKKGLSTVGVHMTWCIFIYYHAAVDAKLSISFELCFCIKLQYYVTDIMMIHSGSYSMCYADSISFNELCIYYNFTTSNKYQLIVKNAIIFSYFKYLDIHFRDNS